MSEKTKKRRRQYSTEEKSAVLRQHLVDKVPVSELCEEHGIQPSVFYNWQRSVMEHIEAALDASNGKHRRRQDSKTAKLQRENEALKARLAKKDGVIAEISEEHFSLKKALGEP